MFPTKFKILDPHYTHGQPTPCVQFRILANPCVPIFVRNIYMCKYVHTYMCVCVYEARITRNLS